MKVLRFTGLAITIVVLLGTSASWPKSTETETKPVQIESGLIEGVQDGAITVYKSIPFAAPPVGELRWRTPQRPASWSGIRLANKFGPVCMQSGASVPGAAEEPVSEDCLTLSVWTAAKTRDAKLPVMVWIPGGGFTQESGSMPLYWGDKLATRGVIVVTINYRVGVFGFLAHPELTRESANHSSGDYGLLDQIAALAWIKRNISAFGGDPQRVTIWGQSAGSMSVNLLMASPLAHGLFQRAIGESGGFFVPPAATGSTESWFLKGAEQQGLKFAGAAGVTSLEALRKLSPEEILKNNDAGTTHPIMDGYVLPLEPYEVFTAGHQNEVPLLLGSNADEGRPLIAGRDVKLATFGADIGKAYGSDVLGELANQSLKVYPAANDSEARESRAEFERDLRFGWDVWTWARMEAKTGKGVYYYYYAHVPPYPKDYPFADWGAGHWSELPYVFDHLSQSQWAWSAADRAMSSTMTTYWTNFAKTGNPNGTGVPEWTGFTAENGQVMHFDNAIAIGGVANLRGLRLIDDRFTKLRADKTAAARN